MDMVRKTSGAAVVFVMLAMGAFATAHAAEIRLRHECRASGALVRLGDVAEVLDNNPRQAQELADIELSSTPQPGQKRFVRAREIQDALQLRGANLAAHRISGASQVEILPPSPEAASAAPLAVSSAALRQAKRAVRDAIVEYLHRTASASDPWDVEFEFNEDQARQIAGSDKELVAAGGTSPWIGTQQFVIAAPSRTVPIQLKIEARVTLPPMTVVAVRSLPRGSTIHISDVKLDRGRPGDADADSFGRLDDVVGKEVARSLAAGQIVRRDAVRAPLVVRRGDVVTVYARQSGLVVRTTARSRDDASLGDVITVESLLNRQAFFARASGVQQVEVFAHAIDASTAGREISPIGPEKTGPEKSGPERVVQQERTGP